MGGREGTQENPALRHTVTQRLIKLSRMPGMRGSPFPGTKEADEFIRSTPFAFLLGVLFNQGMKAEKVWEAPLTLRNRLGHLDPKRIAIMAAGDLEEAP